MVKSSEVTIQQRGTLNYNIPTNNGSRKTVSWDIGWGFFDGADILRGRLERCLRLCFGIDHNFIEEQP